MKGKPYYIEDRFSIIFLIFLSSLILNTIHGEWGKEVTLQCSLVLLSTYYFFFLGRQKPEKRSEQGTGVGGVHANASAVFIFNFYCLWSLSYEHSNCSGVKVTLPMIPMS